MRIVSLCPSLTELVFDLGRGGDLVGRTRFCVRPHGQVEVVEVLGGTKNPKVERIAALAPDLVLINQEENRREDAEAMAAAGLAVHCFFPQDAAATAAMVRRIGVLLERSDAAEALAADIERRAARVQAAVAGRPAVSFAYLIWRKPWMAAGGGTYIDALLTLAGGRNVFGDEERYPAVAAEQLSAADPRRVLLSSEPFPFQAKHVEELAEVTGLPAERFRLVDGENLSWHGSRTPEGIDYAARVIDEGRGG